MASDIWKTLGIEPTKDVIAIKRAYTSLAHKINPEDEPDKFRELHDAYKMALNYAKGGGGIRISFVPAQPGSVTPLENKVTPEFEFSPVSNTSSEKNDESEETLEETPEDKFDFSSLDTEQLNGSVVDNIIDDIVNFRERNKLTTYSEIVGIPLRIRTTLAQTLFTKYQQLVRFSNDISIWNSFIDEPLIRNCLTYSSFREWLLETLDENTVEQLNLREIVSKLGEKEKSKSSDIHEIDVEAEKAAHKKSVFKGLFLPLGICFVLSFIVTALDVVFHQSITLLSAIVLSILVVISGMIAILYVTFNHNMKI